MIQVSLGVTLGAMLALVYTFRDVLPGPETGVSASDSGLLEAPFPAPPLSLLDPDGHPVDLADLRGSVVALFFGYTHCPDVCPITLARLGRYQEARPEAGTPLEVVFVSVDPARDTPERLRAFVRGLPGDVRALSESADEVRRQAFEWGVMVRARTDPEQPEADYLVDHTARTFVMDPQGRVVATLPPMPSADEVDRVLREVFDGLD